MAIAEYNSFTNRNFGLLMRFLLVTPFKYLCLANIRALPTFMSIGLLNRTPTILKQFNLYQTNRYALDRN